MLPAAGFAERRDLLQVRQDAFDHTRPDIVADPARGDIDHADRGFDKIELGQDSELVREHRAADDRMEERGVRRVHRVFHDLQPVAGIGPFPSWHDPIAGPNEAIVDREGRLLVGRSEIGEDQAVRFMRRIGAVTQLVLQRAVSRLARGFQDRAVDVE